MWKCEKWKGHWHLTAENGSIACEWKPGTSISIVQNLSNEFFIFFGPFGTALMFSRPDTSFYHFSEPLTTKLVKCTRWCFKRFSFVFFLIFVGRLCSLLSLFIVELFCIRKKGRLVSSRHYTTATTAPAAAAAARPEPEKWEIKKNVLRKWILLCADRKYKELSKQL